MVSQALLFLERMRGRYSVNGVDLYMHCLQAATHAMQHEDGPDRHDSVVAALLVSATPSRHIHTGHPTTNRTYNLGAARDGSSQPPICR